MQDKVRVKRLEVRDILGVMELDLYLPPGDPVHLFGGPNGGGKSSALTGLLIAMVDAGGHPSEPLRRGASKGVAKVTFDDGMVVTRTIHRGKAPQLSVVDGDGEPMGKGAGGPQRGVLDKLFGKFTWDPTEALRMSDAELRQHLMHLAGIDWSELDKEAARVYAERTAVNRDITRTRAQLDAMPQHSDAPAEHVDTAALVAEQRKARKHDAVGEQLASELRDAGDIVQEHDAEIGELEGKIAELKRQLASEKAARDQAAEAHQEARLAAENWEPLARTGAIIEQELASAAEINAKVDGRAAYLAKAKELQAFEAESQAATRRLKAIEAEKQQQLEAAKFPVEGLGFGDEGVLYNGLPFAQAEESARLRVSVAIGIALNPRMPTMICRYGGGLDERSIELLKQIVAEGGGQLLLEHPWVPPEKCAAYIREGRSVDPEQLKLT